MRGKITETGRVPRLTSLRKKLVMAVSFRRTANETLIVLKDGALKKLTRRASRRTASRNCK